MRIWLLTSELPPETAGGIATYVDGYARLLAARGHEVTIFNGGVPSRQRRAAAGITVVDLGGRGVRDDPNPYDVLSPPAAMSYEIATRVLQHAADVGAPGVIESQEYLALPYYLLQRKLTERTCLGTTPIVVHLHSPRFGIAQANQEPRFKLPDYWTGQMEKFCVVAADALVSPSHYLAAWVRRAIGRDLEIACVPYPLVLGERPVVRPRPGELVAVGRLEPRKGVLPLVQACDRLWDSGHTFRLTLVGGDLGYAPRATTVHGYLRKLYGRWFADGRLRWSDAVPRPEALRLMSEAWAVLVPSVWENFPNTCMEAMGMGQVVLASTAGGQAEMIADGGIAGFVFDWTLEGDFERKLGDVLSLDAAGHARIGSAARARIEALCAPETVLAARVEHYERARVARETRRLFPTTTTRPAPAPGAAAGEQRGLLSIVIPFYNLGAYLPETLASVEASTYTPREVVIVDDGSDDPASRALAEQLEGDTRYRVVRTRNQGLGPTRNAGAAAARGEFIAFVDADDLVEREFFARCVDVLQRFENVGFVYSWVRYFGTHAGIWPTWNAELPYLLGHNMLNPFVVARRAWFLRHGQNRKEMEHGLEDHESWLRLVLAGALGVSLPHALVRYRIRPESMFRQMRSDAFLYSHEMLANLHPDVYREWGPELTNLLNANGPSWKWNHPDVEPDLPWGVSSRYDAELGGRLVERFRRSAAGRLLLRSANLRRGVRRLLGV